jgi:alpha-ketoglutaric semialdehyde dehydrogenase
VAPRTDVGPAPGTITGHSLVAGEWRPVAAGQSPFFAVDPRTGRALPTPFFPAGDDDVAAACDAAREAFDAMSARSGRDRARLLEAAADNIDALGDALVRLVGAETGLERVRLVSERERTTRTLRLFADLARSSKWVRATIDRGDGSRRPVPRPDLRSMLRPVGPVAVFGASNFPLAYSVAGGDTASALAAGCPVVVKGHPAHPGTGEMVARAIADAVSAVGIEPGVFSMLQSGGSRERAVGEALVRHPAIAAVGFTGSASGGLALADIASRRPDPIPVFAEMGSTNPVFILPGAVDADADGIADRLAASITGSTGQMCTCPGLVFVLGSVRAGLLSKKLADRLAGIEPCPMLSAGIRDRYLARLRETASIPGVEVRGGRLPPPERPPGEAPILGAPVLFRARLETFFAEHSLRDEIFGPAVILIACEQEDDMLAAAAGVPGSLAGTIWAASDDLAAAERLRGVLERRVGRLVFNGVPTGVEVSAAMVHAGPIPATNQPRFTAVGDRAIERWVRPVVFQNAPDPLLPHELRDANPLGIVRLVDGELTASPIRRTG